MPHVVIKATAMGYRIPVDKRGMMKGIGINLVTFTNRLIHREYDRLEGVNVFLNAYFHFDEKNEICYLPRYTLEDFIRLLVTNGITYTIEELPPVQGKHIDFMMLPWVGFKNEQQKNAVEYLTNPKGGPLRGLGIQTGFGKTVAFIMALQRNHRRGMIVMTRRLEQWVRELLKYTTLDESDIFVVQGEPSLTKLMNGIGKDLNPKLILVSSKTARRYIEYGVNYQHLPHPSLMCENLDIGVVGTDEYHEHFFTNFLIGIVLNPALFIPITATFTINNMFIKEIFDKFIPESVRFTGGDYVKFVKVTAYEFRSGGHLIKPFHYMSKNGYSQVKLEKHLTGGRGAKLMDMFYRDCISIAMRDHYISVAKPGERCLILCATKKLCDVLLQKMKAEYRDKKITVYYEGMSDSQLPKYDIIISTPGSAGTGTDIPGLITCLVLYNTQSEPLNLQFIGRLRPPQPDQTPPEFVYAYLACIPKHVEYASVRSALYGSRAVSMNRRSIF